ncbi:MAG: dTMP kinase [Acidobacteriota bacterium]
MAAIHPLFVTIEGIEGCGKTTQVRELSRALTAAGVSHLLTREPGGSPLGETLRAVLLDPARGSLDAVTELLLLAAARREHLAQVIEPALASGQTVLCDRFTDATCAYQGYGRGLPLSTIEAVHALPGLSRVPDVTLLLDHPVETALRRARQRQAQDGDRLTRFEDEDLTFHQRVRDGYRALARADPDRMIVIDATGPVDTVHERVHSALFARLGLAV